MPKDLIIEAPRQGISASPHTGFGDVRNLDIFTVPGVALLNNLVAKKSGTTVTGLPLWAVKNPTTPTEVYKLDSAGKVYKSADSGATWALLAGNTFTVTIASPAVFSDTAHGLVENDTVIFATTGALPTGLTAGTTYYVIAAGLTADAFEVSTSQGGVAVNTSGSQSGVHSMLATTNANGNGLKIWKNYLFVCRNTRIDVCGDGTATGIVADKWAFNWKTIDSDTLWHPMLVSKNDNKLYGGAGRYVFSLDEVSGQTFVPATAGTFTWTAQALDLPPNYRIKCLEELGNNLMCGTWMGTYIYDFKVADIFPWDRSAVSFGQPIVINENGINGMLNTGNSLIVMAGIGGTVYKSDGVNAVPIAQIPNSIANLDGGLYLEPLPGAIINYKGRPFFGVSGGGTSAVGGMGVYSLLQTKKGNILTHEHTISTGTDGTSYVVKIGALCGITRDNLLIGWYDATPTASYGIDAITTTSRTTSYGGYFESPLYVVGTPLVKRSYTQIEWQLAKELAANEGIRIKYRVNLTDTWTTLRTYIYSGTVASTTKVVGAVTSNNDKADIPDTEFIQIQIALTGTTTTPRFKSLTLR